MASSLDLSECAQLAPLAELVASLRVAAPGREPLLVGAMARDVLLWYAHGIALARATEDTDFAVAVADWDDFSALRGALVAGGEFAAVPNVHHRLLYRGGRRLDLLPFGGVERADRSIAWPPGQDTVMQVLGYNPHFSHPSCCGRRYARCGAPCSFDSAQRTVEYVFAVSQSARRTTTASRRPRYGGV